MGDFHEHVLFGFFTASVVSFLLRGFIDLTTAELLLSVTMLVIGSILPDIDHKNSYVHRRLRPLPALVLHLYRLSFYLFPST